MWWSRASAIGMVAASLALGGCLAPMYGQFAEGGPGLQTDLQGIAIEPIPDRIGHYLGDDLVFALNGTGSHPTPKYRLFVTLNEAVQTPLIDTVSGRASSATVVINAVYKLEDFVTGLPVTHGHGLRLQELRPHQRALLQHPRRARRRDPRRQGAVRAAAPATGRGAERAAARACSSNQRLRQARRLLANGQAKRAHGPLKGLIARCKWQPASNAKLEVAGVVNSQIVPFRQGHRLRPREFRGAVIDCEWEVGKLRHHAYPFSSIDTLSALCHKHDVRNLEMPKACHQRAFHADLK